MAPGTEVFAQQYAGQPFQILALDLWNGTVTHCESFRIQTGITYPILMMAGTAGVGIDYDCVQTSFFVIDGEGLIRYRRTNAEEGMPAFIPQEVALVVDQAIADLGVSAVADQPMQKNFELSAAYPNPFNPSTTIAYHLSSGSGKADVVLQILDIRGRLVTTLVANSLGPGISYAYSFRPAASPVRDTSSQKMRLDQLFVFGKTYQRVDHVSKKSKPISFSFSRISSANFSKTSLLVLVKTTYLSA